MISFLHIKYDDNIFLRTIVKDLSLKFCWIRSIFPYIHCVKNRVLFEFGNVNSPIAPIVYQYNSQFLDIQSYQENQVQ